MNNQITNLDQIPAYPPKPPQWEITELISQIIGPTRWGRRQLADNLDYENQCISEYHLNQLMESGNIDCHLAQQLPEVLDIDPDMVAYAIKVTGEQQAEHEKVIARWEDQVARHDFNPHILAHIDIDKRRVAIPIIVVCGGTDLLLIDVPTCLPHQPESEQLDCVKELIAGYEKTKKGRLCRNLLNGPTGFSYCPSYDQAWSFTVEGHLTQKGQGPVLPGHAGIRIGNKTVSQVCASKTGPV